MLSEISKQSPEQADDFLAAGVSHEEAGEKWRAGDTAKSARFFRRALDTYTLGLQHFPTSFDLAYNKARVQYDLSQQPQLLGTLLLSPIDCLQEALESHWLALELKPNDADALFNTAQVLTSRGEAISEGVDASSSNRDEAYRSLQQALELFQRCLSLQEFEFTEREAGRNRAAEEGFSASPPSVEADATSRVVTEEQWASIVEPVTRDTLLDTVIAQMSTVTTLCALLAAHRSADLVWIGEQVHGIMEKATFYNSDERKGEVSLARANLLSAYADANFRSGSLDAAAYDHELNRAFNDDFAPPPSSQALCDKADALMAFAASIYGATESQQIDSNDAFPLAKTVWKRLTQASSYLAAATKLPEVQNVTKIHLRRGDCELLRYRLSQNPILYEIARQSAATLLRNAQIYYRGAARAAEVDKSIDEILGGRIREAVVAHVDGNQSLLRNFAEDDKGRIMRVVEEMRDEHLLASDDLPQLSSFP